MNRKLSRASLRPKKTNLLALTLGLPLFLMTLVSGYLFFKTRTLEEKLNRQIPNFMKLNQKLSCENEALDIKTLPACPDSIGFSILPNSFPPHSIFIGYQDSLYMLTFLQSVLEVSRNMTPPLPIMVLVPAGMMSKASSLVEQFIGEPYRDLVRLVHTPSSYTGWPQDYFEFAINNRTGASSLFDFPYQRETGDYIPAALGQACKMNVIRQAAQDNEQDLTGDLGGNVEALTESIVLVGNNMHSAQRKILERNLSQEVVDIDVSWLKVGHVDEVLSVIPFSRKKNNSCGSTILYASPKKALDLLELASKKADQPFMMRVGQTENAQEFDLWSCFTTAKESVPCRTLIRSNQVYEEIMQKNIQLIRSALAQYSPKCKDMEMVEIPVIFTTQIERNNFGTVQDAAFSIHPNPINSVVIGNTILLPKENLPTFHAYTTSLLESFELEPSYVDGFITHKLEGGIHCSMNIRRACRSNRNGSASAHSVEKK